MRTPPILSLVRAVAALRLGRARPSYPSDPRDYRLDVLDGSGPAVGSIPVARTDPGQDAGFPPAVLTGCLEALPDGAPDLRGVWVVERGAMRGLVQRIEQAGDRVVITAGRLVHDMRADGTLANGVQDVDPGGRPIRVVAEYTGGRLDLRPDGGRVMVSRRLAGDAMIWRYGPFRNRCRRLSTPPGSDSQAP